MSSERQFEIQFSGLKEGIHQFEFNIDASFFENQEVEDMIGSDLKVEVELNKTSNMLVLNFEISGDLTFPCDRCLEEVKVPLSSENRLFVKFGPQNDEESEDVIVLSNNAYKINITQFVYEYIILAIPQKKSHDIDDCNAEVLQKLKEYSASVNHGEENDPRWKKLDELK